MSRSLRSYPEEQILSVARRRANNPERGCGYYAAVDYLNKKGIKTKEQKVADAVRTTMLNAGMDPSTVNEGGIRRGKGKFVRKFKESPVSSVNRRDQRALAAFKA